MRPTRPLLRLLQPCALAAALAAGGALGQPSAGLDPELDALAEHGVPGLALRLLSERQPAPGADPEGWWLWERERLRLLGRWQQWSRGAARLSRLPAGLPEATRRQAHRLKAEYLLQGGRAPEARAVLRQLIWGDLGEADEGELALLRRLLIRSYLADQQVADAESAVRRYQQDHPRPDPDWDALRARVLLQAGRPAESLPLLRSAGGPDREPLELLAELRADRRAPEDAYALAEQRAEDTARPDQQRALYWLIAADAAARLGSSARRARAYDELFRLVEQVEALAEYERLSGDSLWQAYQAYGERVGNSLQLLIGNDAAWFEQVAKSLPRYPIRARSLLCALAGNGLEAEFREQAVVQLAQLLVEEPGGSRLLRALFTRSTRYPSLDTVPPRVRYLLLDDALNRADIELASQLMEGLPRPPDGADDFVWSLRRARVLVMGGQVAEGARAVEQLLAPDRTLEERQLDRLMQVLFDLQAVGEHQGALRLLALIGEKPLPVQRQRELLFWMADSRQALGEHVAAARLYLRSARLSEGQGGDPWGQTARYNAAEALADAGLVDDARRIYRALLRATEDANRQSVLRQKLQQLWLRPAAQDNIAPPGGR